MRINAVVANLYIFTCSPLIDDCVAGAAYFRPAGFKIIPGDVRQISGQSALVTTPLQLLAALPVVWSSLEDDDLSSAGVAALIATAALQTQGHRWKAEMQRCIVPIVVYCLHPPQPQICIWDHVIWDHVAWQEASGSEVS